MIKKSLLMITMLFCFFFLIKQSLADELNETAWMMFISSKVNDPVPLAVTFSQIQHDGLSIKGIFKIVGASQYFDNGTINKIKNGYEFKIIIQDSPCNIIFSGKILPISKDGYSPKDAYEQGVAKMMQSNGIKILYKIIDGIMYCKTGFPPSGRTTFDNVTGFIIKPKK